MLTTPRPAVRRLAVESLESRACPAVLDLDAALGFPFRPTDTGVGADGTQYVVGNQVDAQGEFVQGGLVTVTPEQQATWQPLTGPATGIRAIGMSDNARWIDGFGVTGGSVGAGEGLVWDRTNSLSDPYQTGHLYSVIPAAGGGSTVGIPQTLVIDISNNGIATGNSDGVLTAMSWSVSTGIVALPRISLGANGSSLSADGSVIAGFAVNVQGNVQAVTWVDGNQVFLADPYSVGSRVDGTSPDGRVHTGSVSFFDFTDFTTKEQAAVWIDGVLTLITNADGTPHFGCGLVVTNDAIVFGLNHTGEQQRTDTRGFRWSAADGPMLFEDWLPTVSPGDTLAVPSKSVHGVVEDPATHKLWLAVQADGASYAVTVDIDPLEPTHVGTPGPDRIEVVLTPQTARVWIDAGAGADTIIVRGTPRPDLTITIDAGDDNDTVTVNTKVNAVVRLGDGNDVLKAVVAGTVTAEGGDGNDSLVGGSGGNTLNGGAGDDTLTGGKGADLFLGGFGDDRLVGKAGDDTYRFGPDWGRDTLADSAGGSDVVDLSGGENYLSMKMGSTLTVTRIDPVTAVESRLTQISGRVEEVRGSGFQDELRSGNGSNVWHLTGFNAGTMNGLRFSGIGVLHGGSGSDRFAPTPETYLHGWLDGGGGTNTLDYSEVSTPVTVDLRYGNSTGINNQFPPGIRNITALRGGSGSDTILGPDADTVWSITSTDGGKVGPVSFTGFENLTGGTGADTFKFANGRAVSGTVDGGDGSNSLDYSAYTRGVEVNLLAGTSTAVGALARIGTAVGGSGNDLLVAGGSGATLTGGAGRDLLIGGASSSRLSGGSGDDLLIAGATAFDTDLAALRALLAEWARPAAYAVRIDHLTGMTAGGLNGAFVLNETTVPFDEADTLTGGAGVDWFVLTSTSPLNVLTDATAAERVGLG